MIDADRVVTAKLPHELVSRMDQAADHLDRSKSWIVREAVREWLAGRPDLIERRAVNP